MKTFLFCIALLCSMAAQAQNFEKVGFDPADSANGYYLAVRPLSGTIKGVVVFFTWFQGPERIPPETKLHNVAAVNDLLTIYASTGRNVAPNAAVMDRMNRLFTDVMNRYKVDSSLFAVGGGDIAGLSVLRYAELAQEHPGQYVIRPRAVFGVSAAVDLGDNYHIFEREIRKNYPSPSLGDAQAILPLLKKEMGTIEEHAVDYARWTPFDHTLDGAGNERFLGHTAVRLYYDNDIEWRLRARRDSYYDTYLPEGSELIDRLLLNGNDRAEFVAGRQPAMRSNGNHSTYALSIVDELGCVQWIMKEIRPYQFDAPEGWGIERTTFPPPFAPKVSLQGVEEIRLLPGWGQHGSEEYWSGAYMYWLKAGQKIDEAVLEQNFQAYYDGLVVTGGGPVKHQIPADKMVTTKVQVKLTKTEPDDIRTYAGTIDMLDYMAMEPIKLNILVHIKDCGDPGHIPLFMEFSPKPYDDEIWYKLKQPKKQFSCK